MESVYQKLFDYMLSQHDVILLTSEMQEIIDICIEINENIELDLHKPL